MSVSLQDVVNELGLTQESRGSDRTDYFCPQHDNKTGDLSLYNAGHSRGPGFACHREGGGSPVTLVMHCKGYSTVEEALEWLEERFPEEFSNYDEETISKRQKVREILNQATELAHDTLKKQKEEVLEDIKKNRNFNQETIEKAKIGFLSQEDVELLKERYSTENLKASGLFGEAESNFFCHLKNRIVFPYTRNDQTYFMIGRKLPESESKAKYKKTRTTDYNKHILYEYTGQTQDKVIITEGVTDAISTWRAGYDVVSPITTQFRDKDIEKVVERVKHYDEIYIAMDMDEGGIEGAEKTSKQLTKKGFEPSIIQLPEGYDLDDWTTENGYNIDRLVEEAPLYLDTVISDMVDSRRSQKRKLKKKIFELIKGWDRTDQDIVLQDMPGRTSANRSALNEHVEKNKTPKSTRDKDLDKVEIEEEKDTEEEIDDIGSKLRIHDKVIEINPSNKVEISEHLETFNKTVRNEKGVVKKIPQFKVYQIKFGEGSEEEEYKLITKPHRNLNKGFNVLPVKQADLTNSLYQEYFKKKYREIAENNENFDKSFEQWRDDQQLKHFEIAGEISKEAQEKVIQLSNDQILEAIEEYLTYGYEIDTKMKQLMFPKIVKHDKTQVEPKEVMSFAPHTQMWTNTKVGKTYIADRVGENKDDATTAGLVGYADSDGKQKGTLDGVTDAVFIDEFNYGSGQGMNDRLLSLMEKGTHNQSKAGYQIKTKCWSPISYMANPKDNSSNINNSDDEIGGYINSSSNLELVEKFEELIEYLGYNIQAMGSRFGIVLFDQSLDVASGDDIKAERGEKLKTFLEWVKTEVAKEYSEIERELRQWLHQEYGEDYEERVRTVASSIGSDPVVKFWESHIESFRHARGQALRMAVYQNIGDVLRGEYDIDEIREDAEQCFQDVKTINLESLENMANASDDEVMASRAKAMLKGEKPKYVKLFVQSVIALENSDEETKLDEEYEPFSMVKEKYDEIKEDLDSVSDSSMYWKWSRIEKNIIKNKNKHGFRIEQRYGIKVSELKGEPLVHISKPERFNRFDHLDVVNNEISDESDESEVNLELENSVSTTSENEESDESDKLYKEGEKLSHQRSNNVVQGKENSSSGVTSQTSPPSRGGVLTTEEEQVLRELVDYDFNSKLSFHQNASEIDNFYDVATNLEEKELVEIKETKKGDYVNKTSKLEKLLDHPDFQL